MNNREAVNWLINISADIGKAEHSDLWHYEQALTEIKDMLESAQPELNSENLVRAIENGIIAINSNDIYSLGMRNGMRWCKSLIDGVEPKFENYMTSVDDGIDSAELPPAQPVATDTNVGDTISRQKAIDAVNNAFDRETLLTGLVRSIAVRAIRDMPSAQSEPQEGHWIPHESPDGGEQYECSRCGVLWEFNDGTPEDNEAYFCPKCGVKMTISTK